MRSSNYEKRPVVAVTGAAQVAVGVEAVRETLRAGGRRVCVESYPGVRATDILAVLSAEDVFDVSVAYRTPEELEEMFNLGDDPVFARLSPHTLDAFFDPEKLATLRAEINACSGSVAFFGSGASLVLEPDTLVYADLARWEIQARQRAGELGNLGTKNAGERASLLYKRAFFLDWRAADRLKSKLLGQIDHFLETTTETPRLVGGEDVRRGLAQAAHQPLRLVPFFDPAPWGGNWMREVCDLPQESEGGAANYGWCFDCVPEENSLVLEFGQHQIELPALNLVLAHPQELLGERVFARYGAEFPIRFDFLDTMGGGNLSLQVHPLTEHIQDEFGWAYTQDESYYLLDAEPDAKVYLGVAADTDPQEMLSALHEAQASGEFDAEKHVSAWPAAKHDHFLIPAGTIHCSGAGSMVLEISATPFIFTFKLWDWGRLGLDGRPRPINIERGARSIRWERDSEFAQRELINAVSSLESGPGWRSERTGLHEAEPIETHRHWFRETVAHHTSGSVNVLNLVEGEEAVVESPEGAFKPFVVHYAETFIIPASVGNYTITPSGESVGRECATIKAFIRP